MSAFVKKLAEKASSKKLGRLSDTLKPDDVNSRLTFHYGIPSGSLWLAYDSIQQILAISTKDGRIKLFGKDGSQALMESPEAVSSKFLLFIENQGTLINVNSNNNVEVWDINRKCLCIVHQYSKEITSCAVIQNSPYLYIGDSTGYVSVMKLDLEKRYIEHMKYHIPLSASHGKNGTAGSGVAVKFILPQPTAETKRVLIVYCDGIIALWGIQESKFIYSSGDTIVQSMYHETKKVTAACWACTSGSKVAIGYNNGDIVLWSVPSTSDSKTKQGCLNGGQISPVCKLNLGYKLDKIPISMLKWSDGDGKSSQLYVLGCSDNLSTNLLQVVLLNEFTESRTIKLALHPTEPLCDMGIITSPDDKKRRGSLLLLAKSSRCYIYDDYTIERYLVQCQNKASPSLPNEVAVKLPYGDSSIVVAKFITSIPCMPCSSDEDFNMIGKNSFPLFPFERRLKDGNGTSSTQFSAFSKAKNLFITGHENGTINFWDASCPLFLQIASITQQKDDDFSASGIPLTALHFSMESRILVSGDQSGMVRVYTLKSESFAPFQASSKKGSNQIIRTIKLVKVNGSVLSITMDENRKQLAVGSNQGYISIIDIEGPKILYQRHIASEFSNGVISTHFRTCNFHGFEKNVLIIATKDSSILTLEDGPENSQCFGMVRPKKPSRALHAQILDNNSSDNAMSKQALVLLCSERAVYVYSLSHLVQGTKKVLHKKKFNTSCCWASTFGSSDDGLVLLFTNGKIEIRSLPELSLLKENLIKGFTPSTSKSSSISDTIVSSSHDGELIIVNGNQELLFVSNLLHITYRFLDSASQVFDKDRIVNPELSGVASTSFKEKKGIFSSIMKDNKAAKPRSGHEVDSEDSRKSIEELSLIFSIDNFPVEYEPEKQAAAIEEDVDLDIDEIEIDDPKEKPRGYPVLAGLSKQNITGKFQAIKGKLKQAKVKNEKIPVYDELQDKKTGAVDEIKKKYGYSSSDELNVANTARTKLSENVRKLQEINMKTAEMQDTARSFSSMAKEVLRFTENEKKGS